MAHQLTHAIQKLLDHAIDMHQKGDLKGADIAYRQLLMRRPNLPQVLHLQGVLMSQFGQFAKGYRLIERAIRQLPPSAEIQYNAGQIANNLGLREKAHDHYTEAMRLNPHHYGAAEGLGQLIREEGKCEEALAIFQSTYAKRPSARLQMQHAMTIPIINRSEESIEEVRARVANELDTLAETVLPGKIEEDFGAFGYFYLAYHGKNDLPLLRRFEQVYRRAYPIVNTPPVPTVPVRAHGKIRIGFVSCYLRQHTISKLFGGLIPFLDKDRFETFLYRFTTTKHDQVSDVLDSYVDHATALPYRYSDACQHLVNDQLDILVYFDIGMDSLSYALGATRLAPVQCVTFGHPSTTGLSTIDYYLSAETAEAPEADQHYSEKLIRLPAIPVYFVKTPPPEKVDRSEFGLPHDRHLYICPQTLFKLHPAFDQIIAGILRKDQLGTFVLLEAGITPWQPLLLDRWKQTIPDVVDRIQFIPRIPEHTRFLRFLACADVMLDPIHFGGGNTTMEALSVGTPIVTLPGQYFKGRYTAACYAQMGVEGLVASNEEDYIAIATTIATDPAVRAAHHDAIFAAHDRLFEYLPAVEAFETFLLNVAHHSPQI